MTRVDRSVDYFQRQEFCYLSAGLGDVELLVAVNDHSKDLRPRLHDKRDPCCY